MTMFAALRSVINVSWDRLDCFAGSLRTSGFNAAAFSLSCVYSCKEGDELLRRQTVSALAQDYRYPKDIYLISLNAYYVKINLEQKQMRTRMFAVR